MEATEIEVKGEQAREETPLEAFASICTVLVIGLFALTFIFQNFEIPSSSMEKTLLVGDHVLVDRITLAPPTAWAPFVYYRNVRRGDIIVFFKPGEPDLYLVKRVIGIPGDRIHLRNGVVFLNGQPQSEPMAAMPDYGNYFPYRDDFTFVPRANIVGRPLFVYWSFIEPDNQYEKDSVGDKVSFYFHVILHFFDQTRWRRTFHLVR
jgi:signal peptidase I